MDWLKQCWTHFGCAFPLRNKDNGRRFVLPNWVHSILPFYPATQPGQLVNTPWVASIILSLSWRDKNGLMFCVLVGEQNEAILFRTLGKTQHVNQTWQEPRKHWWQNDAFRPRSPWTAWNLLKLFLCTHSCLIGKQTCKSASSKCLRSTDRSHFLHFFSLGLGSLLLNLCLPCRPSVRQFWCWPSRNLDHDLTSQQFQSVMVGCLARSYVACYMAWRRRRTENTSLSQPYPIVTVTIVEVQDS